MSSLDQVLTIASYIIIPFAFLVLALLVLDSGSKGPLTKAYKAGKRARRKGGSLANSPYKVGSLEGNCWVRGFSSADEE